MKFTDPVMNQSKFHGSCHVKVQRCRCSGVLFEVPQCGPGVQFHLFSMDVLEGRLFDFLLAAIVDIAPNCLNCLPESSKGS